MKKLYRIVFHKNLFLEKFDETANLFIVLFFHENLFLKKFNYIGNVFL